MNQMDVLEVLIKAIRDPRIVSLKINGGIRVVQPFSVGALSSRERVVIAVKSRGTLKRPTDDDWLMIPLSHIELAAPSPFPGDKPPFGYAPLRAKLVVAVEAASIDL